MSLTAAVIEISFALSQPPGLNGQLVRIKIKTNVLKKSFQVLVLVFFKIGIVLCMYVPIARNRFSNIFQCF